MMIPGGREDKMEPGVDPAGIQWGCSNPTLSKKYFIFMEILVKMYEFM